MSKDLTYIFYLVTWIVLGGGLFYVLYRINHYNSRIVVLMRELKEVGEEVRNLVARDERISTMMTDVGEYLQLVHKLSREVREERLAVRNQFVKIDDTLRLHQLAVNKIANIDEETGNWDDFVAGIRSDITEISERQDKTEWLLGDILGIAPQECVNDENLEEYHQDIDEFSDEKDSFGETLEGVFKRLSRKVEQSFADAYIAVKRALYGSLKGIQESYSESEEGWTSNRITYMYDLLSGLGSTLDFRDLVDSMAAYQYEADIPVGHQFSSDDILTLIHFLEGQDFDEEVKGVCQAYMRRITDVPNESTQEFAKRLGVSLYLATQIWNDRTLVLPTGILNADELNFLNKFTQEGE